MRFVIKTRWPAAKAGALQVALRATVTKFVETWGLDSSWALYVQPDAETEVLDLLDSVQVLQAQTGLYWPFFGCMGCHWFENQVATADWAVALREHIAAAHGLTYKVVSIRQALEEDGNQKRAPA